MQTKGILFVAGGPSLFLSSPPVLKNKSLSAFTSANNLNACAHVTVSGEYEPSCYGCSLEALARIPCPVRELGRDRLLRVVSGPLPRPHVTVGHRAKFPRWSSQEQSPCQEGLLGVPFEVPKELWLLVDHLHKYGLTQVGNFMKNKLLRVHRRKHFHGALFNAHVTVEANGSLDRRIQERHAKVSLPVVAVPIAWKRLQNFVPSLSGRLVPAVRPEQ